MFIVILTYKKPLEQVDELIPAHLEFLKKYYEQLKIICSGRRKPRVGGVILANTDSLDALWAILKEDPFYTHEIATFDVIEFTPTKCDERFACFVNGT